MKGEDIIKVKHISKKYGTRSIIKDVSLSLEQGEIVGLFGPNGAGKTTCFNIISGLIRPDKGRIIFGKQNITNYPMHLRAKLGICYLPQESSIFRGLNVIDNVKAILELSHSDKETVQYMAERLLEEFGILHLALSPSVSLSGGERRRLEIARTLAIDPKFIMFDEPLAGIDPIAVSDIKYLISKLKNRNIGVLITDHNVRDSLGIIDRGYIIFEGRVLLEGNAEQIITSEQVKDVYLGKGFNV